MKWYKLLYKITGKLKVQQPIRSADVNGDVILEARPNLVSMALALRAALTMFGITLELKD